MRRKAFCFDMDGVIVDSEPLNIKTEKAVCQNHGLRVPNREWEKFAGRTNREIFEYILKNYSDGSPNVDELVSEKRKLFLELAGQELKLFPGAIEFLNYIRTRFPQVSLTTSSSALVQQKIFEIFKFANYFDVVVTGDNVSEGKPSPEPYLITIHKLGVKPAECVVLEDSENGVMSAKIAGATVIGITNSTNNAKLRIAGAKYIIKKFDEALPIIETMSIYGRLKA